MNNFDLDELSGVLVKTTCVDFPSTLASSFFFKGCNLFCPYCYNKNLVLNSENDLCSLNDLFIHLEKRKGIIQGLVISGGEPFLQFEKLKIIIKKAKNLGYKIKIDTNGTFPELLEELLSDEDLKPDFIAMDIKTTPEKYAKIICNKNSKNYNNIDLFEKTLKKSSDLLLNLSPKNREWRTVLVPSLVSKDEIKIMSQFLPKDASWKFAQFLPKNCLNEDFNKIVPYTDNEINEIINFAKKFIKKSEFR